MQSTENPRVDDSIPSLGINSAGIRGSEGKILRVSFGSRLCDPSAPGICRILPLLKQEWSVPLLYSVPISAIN